MAGPDLIMELLADAQASATELELRQEALHLLRQYIAFDNAIFLAGPEMSGPPALLDKDPLSHSRFVAGRAVYLRELEKAIQTARANGGVYLDTEVYTPGERDQLRFYREIIAPQGITSELVAHLYFRGRINGVVHLGRNGKVGGFRERERERLRLVVPALAVAQAAAGPEPGHVSLLARLSPRERQIASCVARGMRTREIAEALGTSPNTVRNQLQRLFEKAGVAGRTELALLLRETR